MSTPEFPESQPVETPSNLADWGTRFVGFLIDYLPILVAYLVAFILGRVSGALGLLANGLVGLAGLGYFIYLGHLDGTTGQTPGKAVQGIKVVNSSGELIGSGSGIARKFAHIVDSLVCGLGYLLPLVDAQRQTIADKIMTTYVVTGAEKQAFGVDLYMPKQGA